MIGLLIAWLYIPPLASWLVVGTYSEAIRKLKKKHVTGENLSLPANPNVYFPLALDLNTTFEDSRPLCARHGVADALWSYA